MKDVTDQIEKLAELRERDLITEEEYHQQKNAALSRLHGPDSKETIDRVPAPAGQTSTTGETGFSSRTGNTLGPYTILKGIGEGGMGSVYRAQHRSAAFAERFGGDVAIKVLHEHYTNRPEILRRFEREAALGIQLQHPGIVKVHEMLVDGSRFALAMELVEGRQLSDMIGMETGPIDWSRAAPLVIQLLDAIEYAHSQGVVHRDLKPDNIMISPSGSLKVLDFGIAKVEDANRTKTGTGMGTVDYMAPEQYTNACKVDARADVYALGMTMYEMLAGRLPWEKSASEFEIMKIKEQGEFPPPNEFYPYIPEQLVSMIKVATDPDPTRRFSKVSQLKDLISKLPGDLAVSEHALPPGYQHGRASEPGSKAELVLEEIKGVFQKMSEGLRNLTGRKAQPKPVVSRSRPESSQNWLGPLTPSIEGGVWAKWGAQSIIVAGLLPGVIPWRRKSYWDVGWMPDLNDIGVVHLLHASDHLIAILLGFMLLVTVRQCRDYAGPGALWKVLGMLGLFYILREPLIHEQKLELDLALALPFPGIQVLLMGLMGATFRLGKLPPGFHRLFRVLALISILGGIQILTSTTADVSSMGIAYLLVGGLVALGTFDKVTGALSATSWRVLSVGALVAMMVIAFFGEPELERLRSNFPGAIYLVWFAEHMLPPIAAWTMGTVINGENGRLEAK